MALVLVPISTQSGEALQERVREACERRLARFKQPVRIEVVAALPRTVTGKIAQGRLRTVLRREGIAANGANELETLIADLNRQMLQAANELKFELAARLRDELSEMKGELRQMEKAGHLV